MPDGTEEYLNIDPDTYTHAEFGIFVKDASVEFEKLQQLKGLGQTMAQNGVPISTIAEIIESDNFVEVKDKVKKAEAAMQEMEQQAQEMDKQLQEQEQALRQEELDREDLNKELDRQNKIEVELVKKDIQKDMDDMWKKELERRKLEDESRIKNRELSETERSNRAQEKLKSKEISAKKQQSTTK